MDKSIAKPVSRVARRQRQHRANSLRITFESFPTFRARGIVADIFPSRGFSGQPKWKRRSSRRGDGRFKELSAGCLRNRHELTQSVGWRAAESLSSGLNSTGLRPTEPMPLLPSRCRIRHSDASRQSQRSANQFNNADWGKEGKAEQQAVKTKAIIPIHPTNVNHRDAAQVHSWSATTDEMKRSESPRKGPAKRGLPSAMKPITITLPDLKGYGASE